jgi:osmotically-inducible protein OsmY
VVVTKNDWNNNRNSGRSEMQNWGSDYGNSGQSNFGNQGRIGSQSGSGYGSSDYNTSSNSGSRFGNESSGWQSGESRSGMQGGHRGKGPKGYERSQDRIKEDISDRLTDDDSIDASDIEINVNNGEVTLSGTVSDKQTKRRVEDMIESMSGVKSVQNNLRCNQAKVQYI